MLSISWHVRVFVCLFVCLSVTLSHSLEQSFCYHFPKSNVQTFWYSESLGKSNGKEWSQIWILLLIKGVKWPPQKKFFDGFFYLFILFKRLFVPTFQSQMSKLFRYSEFLGKSKGKELSQIVKRGFASRVQDFFPNMFLVKMSFFMKMFFWVKICFFVIFILGENRFFFKFFLWKPLFC